MALVVLYACVFLSQLGHKPTNHERSDVERFLDGSQHALSPPQVRVQNRVPSNEQQSTTRKEQPKRRRKLQEKLDDVFLTTGSPYQGDLWELSDYIPHWMKGKHVNSASYPHFHCIASNLTISPTITDYFAWHKEELPKLNSGNWESHRILVMQCLKGSDTKCGGTADRLKPFLFLLREAHESKRLLFIHWTLPARIEEFLVPPVGGIDWRAPQWMEEVVRGMWVVVWLMPCVESFLILTIRNQLVL